MSIKGLAIALAPLALLCGVTGSGPVLADAPSMRIRAGITESLSPHVHVIPAQWRFSVPNVGIVVGSRAVLVVDTGLGTASGQTVLDETRRIAGDRPIYVIPTHFHPEHIGGENAFPASATILRSVDEQREVEELGDELIETFRAMSSDNKQLLDGFSYRPADIIFDGPMKLDLGGVTAQIIKAGPAHTDGDIAVLVPEDGVLFTGDVVQQNYAPIILGDHSTADTWLAQIDMLEKLPAKIVVPAHSPITDRAAFDDMREMVSFARDRWAQITQSGLSGKAAEDRLAADYKARFPACGNADLVRLSVPRLSVADQ